MGTLLSRRRYMGAGEEPLPQGAIRIEYLQSSGTQYIKTGLVTSQDVFTFDFAAACSNSSSNTRVILGGDRGFNVSVVSGKYRATGNCVSNVNASIDTPVHVIFTTTPSAGTLSLQIDNDSFSGVYSNFVYNGGISLFAVGNGSLPSSSRIYYVKIYKNNVLIMDFIPVRKGTKGYMYDKVSKQLFGNAGTGSFTLGPDKT